MTRLFNRPADFAKELVEGFAAAHADMVRQVPGGVVRSTRVPEGEVALVIGGGSGHYPAFCGLVGQGLAHGAAMGNLFASPSAKQAYSVARAADNGGGVILSFGNYAGDVLHFGLAKDRLNNEGIRCEILTVTDDISSAPIDQIEKRRGIAGDLTVFKVAGAAAAAGRDFDTTLALAKRANDRTRSLGVAFSGCTLPGASAPLFSVEPGKMELGMGIHGEPGIKETDIPTAEGLANELVEALLKELPEGISGPKGQRVAVILNGLGSVKYEELFVVYRTVDKLLKEAGIEIVEPEVGELVTSFDMAGVSLTLFWLDEELEALWCAPTLTPAYRKGEIALAEPLDAAELESIEQEVIPEASEESRQATKCMLGALEAAQKVVVDNAEELGRLDAIAGDGDHGIGMERGVIAAVEKAHDVANKGAGVGTLLTHAGDAWADIGGGTSGALWGVALAALGTSIGNQSAPNAESVAKGIEQALEGMMHFGKAKVGDKTMLDALVPFSKALNNEVKQGTGLAEAWRKSVSVAQQAAKDSADLLPKVGRARPLAEKSLGTPDPGATSLAMILEAVGKVIS